MNAITARLGLETKDFQKDLGSASALVDKFAGKATQGLSNTSKHGGGSMATLGHSIRAVIDQTLAGGNAFQALEMQALRLGPAFKIAFGPILTGLGIGMAVSKIIEANMEVRKLNREVSNVLRPVSPDFSSIDELKSRLEQTTEAAEKLNDSIGGHDRGNAGSITKNFLASMGDDVLNAFEHNGKYLFGERSDTAGDSVRLQAQVQAQRRQLAIAIADKEGERLSNQVIGAFTSPEMMDEEESKRKRDEKKGAAARSGNGHEYVQKAAENADREYDLEIAKIQKKYSLEEEEFALKRQLASFTGTEVERTKKGLEAEISMLSRVLKTRTDLNAIEREGMALRLQQQQQAYRAFLVEQYMKTPQQRQVDADQSRSEHRAERLVDAQYKDVKDQMARGVTKFSSRRKQIAEDIKKGIDPTKKGSGVDLRAIETTLKEIKTNTDNLGANK